HKLPLFGPSKKGALLESSKAWSKGFMVRNRIPTAQAVICHSYPEALKVIETYCQTWNGIVVKCSGLTEGKGRIVCQNAEEAREALHTIMEEKRFGQAGSEVVLEERLEGPEISLLAFADGKRMIPMLPTQDHKRLYAGDQGPNTGGVGAYAPTPFV